MKLKDLKRLLDKLTPKQLNKELLYNSDRYSISGEVSSVKTVSANLYYTGEDDPAKLYTRKQLKENGYTVEEIEDMEIEICKGDIVINI